MSDDDRTAVQHELRDCFASLAKFHALAGGFILHHERFVKAAQGSIAEHLACGDMRAAYSAMFKQYQATADTVAHLQTELRLQREAP